MSLPSPITAFTQQDFLNLFSRILPVHYLAPLISPGPGYEALQAFAKMFARVSEAAAQVGDGAFIANAPSGAYATGQVNLYRDTPNTEGIAVEVLPGTVVYASASGRRFVTTTGAFFSPVDLGPIAVNVQALAYGREYNLPGMVTNADGSVSFGEIDSIETLVESPEMGDTTIKVQQILPTTGGQDAYLDQLGADRLVIRADGETDAAYRARITSIPDNISPTAVDRAVQQLLLPYGQSYQFIETWDIQYQTCYDAPSETIAGSNFDPNLFCYDDPRVEVIFRNRWLDVNEMRGAFVIVVPYFGPIKDVGMAYDDTVTNASGLVNPLGLRAVSAWDVTSQDDSFGYLQGCFDGYDIQRAATMRTLYETLQEIKAAGVAAILELQGE